MGGSTETTREGDGEGGGVIHGLKRGIEFSEPKLYQHNPTPNEMGGYSSVPFACSLCFMEEMDIQDNKLEVEYKR